jgi:hypothetical protein
VFSFVTSGFLGLTGSLWCYIVVQRNPSFLDEEMMDLGTFLLLEADLDRYLLFLPAQPLSTISSQATPSLTSTLACLLFYKITLH